MMPVLLSFLERMVMVNMNKGPAPFLDIVGGFSFFVVRAAVQLDLFEKLRSGPRTATDLAAATGGDERGLTILLEVLESLGYTRCRSGRYENSKMTEKWMLADSPTSFRDGFLYYGPALAELWPHLDRSVAAGAPHTEFYEWLADHPDTSKDYQRFMMNLARMVIPELRQKFPVSSQARKVIDIGGGHGLYSVGLCQHHEALSATIFDSRYSRPLAQGNIDEAGLAERIRFVEGDYFSDDLGSDHDIALLFNVVHEHKPAENAALVARAANALADGGSVAVLDVLREKKPTNTLNLISRIYSLIFLHTVGGRTYSFDEIAGWLRTGGLAKVKRIRVGQSGMDLVIGTKPAA